MVARARRSSSPQPAAVAQRQAKPAPLPKLVLDPVWSLKPWPLTVTVYGEELEIPALPAADWLSLLTRDDLPADSIFPGLCCVEDRMWVMELVHDGSLEWDAIRETALEVIGTVSGREWYTAFRLIHIAWSSWDALGGMLMERADPERLSLAGWLDIAFKIMLESIEDDKRTMFLSKLELPPPGIEVKPEVMEMSAEAFMAMA